MSFDTSADDQSATSDVTIDFFEHSDLIVIDSDDDDSSSECEEENSIPKILAQQNKRCRCVNHHTKIDNMLADKPQLEVGDEEEYVKRFKELLNGLEDYSYNGKSIFFHAACELNDSPNPLLTVVKLIQLFDAICQIAMSSQSTTATNAEANNNTRSSQFQQLFFRPWRKSSRKDCGVILQMLYIATFEILNSREDFIPPETPSELDQQLGVTFGLQILQTMARNVLPEESFGDQPLKSYEVCIRRDCNVERKVKFVCSVCGVRFHKSCCERGDSKSNAKFCPPCHNSALLLEAVRSNKLADVYSLVVEKGASPLQPRLYNSTRYETSLHVAVQTNNYELASMFLYGAHCLLSCDDSLAEWKFPKIAWPMIALGLDNKLITPFEAGVESTVTNMSVRPPVEVLLLLCGRGGQEKSEEVHKALEIRSRMMLAMKSMNNRDELLKIDISKGLEPSPIPVFTRGHLPSFHIYVGKNVESRSTAIRWFDCRSRGLSSKQLSTFQGECSFEKRKVLHHNQGGRPSWRTSCNYLCECRTQTNPNKSKCECELAEEGAHRGLEVFETLGRGYGLRTSKGVTIKKNEVICTYAGEIITSKEAELRDEEYDKRKEKGSYMLDIDEQGHYCIDATKFRSVAALINHSCSESNCELKRALHNHLDTNFPQLQLRAKKDIGELTELTFNYVRGKNDSGDKPSGYCIECQGEHCLCRQCCIKAHRSLNL